MAPIIVLGFFAAQFIAYFQYSGLGLMLAMAGGQVLGQAEMPSWMLIIFFIVLTMFFNLLIGSMSAKYALFAPIFIPMLPYYYIGFYAPIFAKIWYGYLNLNHDALFSSFYDYLDFLTSTLDGLRVSPWTGRRFGVCPP